MKNNKFKKVYIKNCMYYYFDDIIKLEDFNLNNISIDEKSNNNILIYGISQKTLMIQNLSELESIKQVDLLEFMMETEQIPN